MPQEVRKSTSKSNDKLPGGSLHCASPSFISVKSGPESAMIGKTGSIITSDTSQTLATRAYEQLILLVLPKTHRNNLRKETVSNLQHILASNHRHSVVKRHRSFKVLCYPICSAMLEYTKELEEWRTQEIASWQPKSQAFGTIPRSLDIPVVHLCSSLITFVHPTMRSQDHVRCTSQMKLPIQTNTDSSNLSYAYWKVKQILTYLETLFLSVSTLCRWPDMTSSKAF